MNKRKMTISRKGSALIIAMFFVILFSSLSVAMFTMTFGNMRIADNHQDTNRAFESANSGFEFVRYWLSRVGMPGTTAPADRFTTLVNFVNTDTGAAGLYSAVVYDEDAPFAPLSVGFTNIAVNAGLGQTFTATLTKTADLDVLQLDVTGSYGTMNRTIRANYTFGTRAHNVFDFGVATRGPLTLLGNVELTGTNVSVEADVYIESLNNNYALSVGGHSQIAGDVTITNPDAVVDINGQAGVGGATGYTDSMEHVDIGEAPVEFPVPNPTYFQQYVQNTYDPETTDTTFTNVVIPAGTNPTFGDVTFNGIVYIESPNVVTFTGNTTITGLIVGAGDLTDNSGNNQINFHGTVVSNPVSDLPAGAEFDGLRDETGTFLIAPGFKASFTGNFNTLNGAIAANGIAFDGNAGGTIGGSVLNYSDEPMVLGGNGNLFFNRSGVTEVPAGFGPEIILHYNASTYVEAPTG